MNHRSLSVSLQAEPTYRLGEPIVIGVEIKNTGNDTLQLLEWGTPLEDQLTGHYLIVERDGETLPYDGKLVKRGDPRIDDYVTIDAGETLETTVEVSAGYPIDQPGHYTVAVNATFLDAFTTSGKEKQEARTREDHKPLSLTDSAVSFEVLPGEAPMRTAGEIARQEQPEVKAQPRGGVEAEEGAAEEGVALEPNFVGGTAEQQQETLVAHGNAQNHAALAASKLSGGSVDPLYQTWFGEFEQGRFDTVTQHYGDISNTLLSEQVTYDLSGEGCQPGVFAYTYFGSRTVWLCSSYLSASEEGTDTKFGTLIHEWSHAICETDDHAYGTTRCKELAENEPDVAVDNADNHEYFTEFL